MTNMLNKIKFAKEATYEFRESVDRLLRNGKFIQVQGGRKI